MDEEAVGIDSLYNHYSPSVKQHLQNTCGIQFLKNAYSPQKPDGKEGWKDKQILPP